MTLHRAGDSTALCATCAYDKDDSCTFPKRPHAQSCTLYVDVNQPVEEEVAYQPKRNWIKENIVWIAIALILAVSLLPVIF